ncbi:MAG: CBS domain-containing protein [Pirellulales bacterium]
MLDQGIENLVTYNPLAICERATLGEALSSMDEYHFHHLPVVDQKRRLVGIVSDLDVRRAADTRASNVADVMTPSPIAVAHHSSPTEALRIMLERRFHSVPVLDGDKLIGIITSTDFLREFSYETASSGDTIAQHMLGDEYHVGADSTVDEALRAMDELGCDFLAVLKGTCPVGVVSRRTLTVWTEFSQATGPTQVKTMQLAATNVPALLPSDTLQDAARRMLDRGVSVVLVADRANQFVGLLTDIEVLSLMIERMAVGG